MQADVGSSMAKCSGLYQAEAGYCLRLKSFDVRGLDMLEQNCGKSFKVVDWSPD